jgi:hypothetical protein
MFQSSSRHHQGVLHQTSICKTQINYQFSCLTVVEVIKFVAEASRGCGPYIMYGRKNILTRFVIFVNFVPGGPSGVKGQTSQSLSQRRPINSLASVSFLRLGLKKCLLSTKCRTQRCARSAPIISQPRLVVCADFSV